MYTCVCTNVLKMTREYSVVFISVLRTTSAGLKQ